VILISPSPFIEDGIMRVFIGLRDPSDKLILSLRHVIWYLFLKSIALRAITLSFKVSRNVIGAKNTVDLEEF